MNKLILYLLIILFITNCSLSKKNFKTDEKITEEIFEKIKPINKEFNENVSLKLENLTTKEPFLNNLTNNIGHIDLNNNFKKFKSFKFKTISEFQYIQPEIIFSKKRNIIFFDGKGSVFKISTDMQKIWQSNYYSKKEKKLDPVIYFGRSNNKIFIADTLSKIYSLDAKTGNLLWEKKAISPFNSNIVVYNNSFMAVDFDNVIRCFSEKDGKEIWNFKTENSFIKSHKKLSIILKNNIVYFINNLGDLTALNANDGSLIWQTPTQSNVIFQNAFSLENSDLVIDKETIYFSNNKNEFFGIDVRSGIIKWKQTVNSSITPIIVGNIIFTVSEEGFLFALEANSGNILRITNIFKQIKNKKKSLKPIGFIVAANKIYVSTNKGKLIKRDLSTNTLETIYKVSSSKISKPYVFNNKIYLIKNNSILRGN